MAENPMTPPPNLDLLEALASQVHQAYLDTCARLGWPVKPANQVPYAELSEDSKELDRASVRAVLENWPLAREHGQMKGAAISAVDDEPEFPGDMPDEMWEALRNDRDAMTQAMRLAVSHTKRDIKARIASLTPLESPTAKAMCACGHDHEAHTGHTHRIGDPEPTFCSQGCGCKAYDPTAKGGGNG